MKNKFMILAIFTISLMGCSLIDNNEKSAVTDRATDSTIIFTTVQSEATTAIKVIATQVNGDDIMNIIITREGCDTTKVNYGYMKM